MGRRHVLGVVEKRLALSGLEPATIKSISVEDKLRMANGFFGGGHELILARRHYVEGAEYDNQLASSGSMTPGEHYQYIHFTIDAVRDIYVTNLGPNVLFRNERAGLVFGGFEAAAGRVADSAFPGNTLFQNNTVGESGQGTYFPGGGVAEIWVQWASGNVIENNIVDAGPEKTLPAEPNSSGNNTPSGTIHRRACGDWSDSTHRRCDPSRTNNWALSPVSSRSLSSAGSASPASGKRSDAIRPNAANSGPRSNRPSSSRRSSPCASSATARRWAVARGRSVAACRPCRDNGCSATARKTWVALSSTPTPVTMSIPQEVYLRK